MPVSPIWKRIPTNVNQIETPDVPKNLHIDNESPFGLVEDTGVGEDLRNDVDAKKVGLGGHDQPVLVKSKFVSIRGSPVEDTPYDSGSDIITPRKNSGENLGHQAISRTQGFFQKINSNELNCGSNFDSDIQQPQITETLDLVKSQSAWISKKKVPKATSARPPHSILVSRKHTVESESTPIHHKTSGSTITPSSAVLKLQTKKILETFPSLEQSQSTALGLQRILETPGTPLNVQRILETPSIPLANTSPQHKAKQSLKEQHKVIMKS